MNSISRGSPRACCVSVLMSYPPLTLRESTWRDWRTSARLWRTPPSSRPMRCGPWVPQVYVGSSFGAPKGGSGTWIQARRSGIRLALLSDFGLSSVSLFLIPSRAWRSKPGILGHCAQHTPIVPFFPLEEAWVFETQSPVVRVASYSNSPTSAPHMQGLQGTSPHPAYPAQTVSFAPTRAGDCRGL